MLYDNQEGYDTHDDVIKWKHFPRYWPVTRSFDVFFDLHLNKRLSKQWRGWWFETPSRPVWRHVMRRTRVIRMFADVRAANQQPSHDLEYHHRAHFTDDVPITNRLWRICHFCHFWSCKVIGTKFCIRHDSGVVKCNTKTITIWYRKWNYNNVNPPFQLNCMELYGLTLWAPGSYESHHATNKYIQILTNTLRPGQNGWYFANDILSNRFLWMKNEPLLEFHWSLFLRVW